MPRRPRRLPSALGAYNRQVTQEREQRKAAALQVLKTHAIKDYGEIQKWLLTEHGISISRATIIKYVAEIGASKNPMTGLYEIQDWKLTEDEWWNELAIIIHASVHDCFVTPGADVVLITDHGVSMRVAIIINFIREQQLAKERTEATDNVGAVFCWDYNAVEVKFRSRPSALAFRNKVLRFLGGENIIQYLNAPVSREEGEDYTERREPQEG